MTFLFWLLFGFLMGSIPTALWVGLGVKGIDPRTAGSGNLGATNVFRTIGKGAGWATLGIDILKGFLPVYLSLRYLGGTYWPVGVGAAAVIGHTASPWVHFRGGKGVATSAGVFLALLPIPLAFAVGGFGIGFGLTRKVSVGSLIACVVLPVAAFLFPAPPGARGLALALAALVVIKHIPNIRRLLRGEEMGVGTSPEKNS